MPVTWLENIYGKHIFYNELAHRADTGRNSVEALSMI